MKATITIDHRLSDGADTVPFRVRPRNSYKRSRKSIGTMLAGFLENPVSMLV